jgi:hypothetical protein
MTKKGYKKVTCRLQNFNCNLCNLVTSLILNGFFCNLFCNLFVTVKKTPLFRAVLVRLSVGEFLNIDNNKS